MFEEDLFVIVAAAANDQSIQRKRAGERWRFKTQSLGADGDSSRIDLGFCLRGEGVCFIQAHFPQAVRWTTLVNNTIDSMNPRIGPARGFQVNIEATDTTTFRVVKLLRNVNPR